jgi:4-hydroxybenzoate polyprenyltransferase
MKEKLKDYAMLLTINLWGVFCLTGVFGALSTGNFNFISLFLLALLGVLATVFSNVFNDYMDIEVDSLSKELKEKPLVKGSIPKINALYISIFAVIASYIITIWAMFAGYFIINIYPLILITIALILGTIYNMYGKKFPGSDLLVATAGSLFCLFGAMVVSETISLLTVVLVLLVFVQFFYMNAFTGGLKDADHDYLLNIKNLSFRLGVKVIDKKVTIPILFKTIAMLLRTSSAVLLFIPFFFIEDFPYYIWQPVIIILMLFGIFYTTIKTLQLKIFERNEIRQLFSIQSFLRYVIVPFMLFKFVGYQIALFLIIFPFLWFVVFNRIMYKTTLKPKRM